MQRHELEGLSRDELIAHAERLGVPRPRVLTQPELIDEIMERSAKGDQDRGRARGWLGRAKDLLVKVVERGLHLPDSVKTRAPASASDRTWPTPPTPLPTVTLAEVYAAQGHLERAISVLDEVLSREPDHDEARVLRDRFIEQAQRTRAKPTRAAEGRAVEQEGAPPDAKSAAALPEDNLDSASSTTDEAPSTTDQSKVEAAEGAAASSTKDDANQNDVTADDGAIEATAPETTAAETIAEDPAHTEVSATSIPETQSASAAEAESTSETVEAPTDTVPTKSEAKSPEPITGGDALRAEAARPPEVNIALRPAYPAKLEPPTLESAAPGMQELAKLIPQAIATSALQIKGSHETTTQAALEQPTLESAAPNLTEITAMVAGLAKSTAAPTAPAPQISPEAAKVPSAARGSEARPQAERGEEPGKEEAAAAKLREGAAAAALDEQEGLPDRYDVDEVVAIAVDPQTLYIYWEVRSATLARSLAKRPEGGLALRIIAVTPSWDGPIVKTWDLPVDALYGDRFVRDIPPGANVRVSVGLLDMLAFEPFAVGIEVASPRALPIEPPSADASPQAPETLPSPRARRAATHALDWTGRAGQAGQTGQAGQAGHVNSRIRGQNDRRGAGPGPGLILEGAHAPGAVHLTGASAPPPGHATPWISLSQGGVLEAFERGGASELSRGGASRLSHGGASNLSHGGASDLSRGGASDLSRGGASDLSRGQR